MEKLLGKIENFYKKKTKKLAFDMKKSVNNFNFIFYY